MHYQIVSRIMLTEDKSQNSIKLSFAYDMKNIIMLEHCVELQNVDNFFWKQDHKYQKMYESRA